MRKHGWQLPYHPLQVVAVSVFLALGFAFYVFFAPFVGKKMLQYIAMGIYTPLITCAFSLYIWCAAADPADPGVFKSKRYLKIPGNGKHAQEKDSKLGGQSISSMQDGKSTDTNLIGTGTTEQCQKVHARSKSSSRFFCALLPCTLICKCCISSEESSEHQMSEDAMFYCSLCEVEVNKYSKHCRVCDKCVDRFDHHCRWINNCIGKKNYRKFFTLMVSALLLLILQWSTGILVLISCFLERKRFYVDIAVKLGSSFSLVPFVIVVGMCTLLAMIATLPLAQLFFFHILLIKKGISTYDYIVALREQDQEQQGIGGHQSAQMSPMSSITGLSSASSFSTFHRAGAWCTPPRLFVEDQFDAIPPENASVSSFGKKNVEEEPMKKKNQGAVKISPWTLARLNAEEVTRAAAEARKRSKILKPVMRQESAPFRPETGTSFLNSGHQVIPRPENSRKRANKMANLPPELSTQPFTNISTSFAPLQLEARSAFQTSRAMSSSTGVVGSSPESSLDSPDIRPFQAVPMGAEEPLAPPGLSAYSLGASRGLIQVSRNSTSDGYEASGGEDSDRVPSRFVHRSTNWSNLMSSSSQLGNRKF